MEGDLYGMMMKLAERALGKSLSGEGSQESRSIALILSAIDQLSTAAQLDRRMAQSIDQAIEVLRQKVEEQASVNSPRQQSPQPFQEKKQPKERQEETEEEEEGEEKNA